MSLKISRSLNSQHRATSALGFTLIEVLVVLIIVSIVTAVAVLSFGSFDRGRREKIIVEQFVRAISAAQEQAILTPMVLGLTITPNGYQFYQYRASLKKAAKWEYVKNDVFSNSHAFHSVFSVAVKFVSGFSPSPKNVAPAILFLPSGFVTPFEVALKGNKQVFNIKVKNNGGVTSDA